MNLMVIPAFLALIASTFGAVVERDPMLNPDLFEGDILGVDPNTRVINVQSMRWTDNTVIYDLAGIYGNYHSLIKKAMNRINVQTGGCIKFRQRNSYDTNYIRFFHGQGCYSYVGMISRRGQELSLAARGCMHQGTIMHELLHAIGFFHEQSRPDRDNYLYIYWNNMQQGMSTQFRKNSAQQDNQITKFDYNSIMMYGSSAFSANGQSTMLKRPNYERIAAPNFKTSISQCDVDRIRVAYGCKAKPSSLIQNC